MLKSDVFDKEVNENYLVELLTLNSKCDFLNSLVEETETKSGATRRVKPSAVIDVEPKLQLLCQKASGKVKTFMLNKIGELKKKGVNIPYVKQHVLLRFKFFQEFLERHNTDAAQEVCLFKPVLYCNLLTL